MWIEATLGEEGFAARGFTRSLRKETFSVSIRLVLFDSSWGTAARTSVIQRLARIPDLEDEVLIDQHGFVQVPRLTPFPISSQRQHFPPSYWVQRDSPSMVPYAPHSLPLNTVLVKVISLSPPEGGLRGFAGVIEDSGDSEWDKGTPVFGVHDGPLSNCAVVHEGQLACMECSSDAALYSDHAIPLLIASWSLGMGCFQNSKRLRGRRIALTEGNAISSKLRDILSILDLEPILIPQSPSLRALSLASEADIVLSGFEDANDISFLRSAIGEKAAAFFWNSTDGGVRQRMRLAPWLVGETLQQTSCAIPQ